MATVERFIYQDRDIVSEMPQPRQQKQVCLCSTSNQKPWPNRSNCMPEICALCFLTGWKEEVIFQLNIKLWSLHLQFLNTCRKPDLRWPQLEMHTMVWWFGFNCPVLIYDFSCVTIRSWTLCYIHFNQRSPVFIWDISVLGRSTEDVIEVTLLESKKNISRPVMCWQLIHPQMNNKETLQPPVHCVLTTHIQTEYGIKTFVLHL